MVIMSSQAFDQEIPFRNPPKILEVTFFTQFMELIEETEAKGMDVDAFRMCIADVSRELDCGAFAQGERALRWRKRGQTWDLGRCFGEAKRAKRWKNAGFLSGGNCWMWENRTENGGTWMAYPSGCGETISWFWCVLMWFWWGYNGNLYSTM